MPASLIDSQFAALEPPHNEANVFPVDATLPVADIAARAVTWLETTPVTGDSKQVQQATA
jgi:gluconokinase